MMGWPGWASLWNEDRHEPAVDLHKARSATTSTQAPLHAELNHTPSSAFAITSPILIAQSALLTAGLLGAAHVYKRHLGRLPTVAHIKPSEYRTRTLRGYVTSVGDGDDFRFFHTPGGIGAGWGWLPGRRAHVASPRTGNAKTAALPKKIRDATMHVRIAGIDAPELAHFGRPAQPYGEEALACLRGLVLHKTVRAKIWRPDQYGRVVATVHFRAPWTGLWRRRDVGLEMLKAGAATVYEAKFGSEFGGQKHAYLEAERQAKEQKLGLWAGSNPRNSVGGLMAWLGAAQGAGPSSPSTKIESPREFKDRMKRMDDKGK